MKKKILITGGNGFIGKALNKKLIQNNYFVKISSRKKEFNSKNLFTTYRTGEIDGKTKWDKILDNIDCVVHCAAITSNMNKDEGETTESFRKVNIEGTINLARQSASMGVKRFIFLSSIKVNGEKTFNNSSFKYYDIPNPSDNYSNSKWIAEQELIKISNSTNLELIIIRSPLVYGPGAKGNFKRLINVIKTNMPLPLAMVQNQRSMIGIENLIDLLIQCIDHPKASGKIFLASDGEDLSTSELIKLIASSMGRKANLFPFPISILKFLGSVLGKREEINRLVGSLRIDNSYTKEILNWTPPVSVEEGIRRMVQGK